jgi:hypothetical protein
MSPIHLTAQSGKQFGHASATYIQTCISLQILKQGYCKKIIVPTTELCIEEAVQNLPRDYQSRAKTMLSDEFSKNYQNQIDKLKPSIEIGFKETLRKLSGDTEKACSHFLTSTQELKSQIYQDIIKISRNIK